MKSKSPPTFDLHLPFVIRVNNKDKPIIIKLKPANKYSC